MTRKLTIILLIQIIVFTSCKQNDSGDIFKRNLKYFLQTKYSELDSISDNNSYVFYYKDSYPNEKVYLKKDTIEHIFGHFGDNGTMWMKETLFYNSNGNVIDDKSQYILLKENNDSINFELIGEKDLSFEVRTHTVSSDSLNVTGVLDTFKPKGKTMKIPLKNIKGHPVSVIFRKEFFENDTVKSKREMEFFIAKDILENTKKHLELINDIRFE